MAENSADDKHDRTMEEQTPQRSSLATAYGLLRFALGFAVCFWLWAKWLFSPQMFFLPPLPPVEVLVSLVERILGLWLVAFLPILGAILIGLDGLESKRAQRLAWWKRRLLLGVVEAVLIHVVTWVAGSLLFFGLLALLPGSDVRGRAFADPVVQGVILFCAFLSLIVAGPATALIVALRRQALRRREGLPPTRLDALNNTMAVLLAPLLLLWLASGYPREILRPFAQAAGAKKEARLELATAAREGRAEPVGALLQRGAQVNVQDPSGTTPLMAAAANGHVEIVRMLIAAGADVNAGNNLGRTALMSAAGNRYAEIVCELIKARAEVNAKDTMGRTALMLAASGGQTDITQALIQAGADVNAASAAADTALMSAARGGHTEVVHLLVRAGARLEARDKNGSTALQMAAALNHVDTVRALREAGARD
jgi:ankyrin repeat protein